MAVSINGTTVPDCILSLDVTNNTYFAPDTFRVEPVLNRLPVALRTEVIDGVAPQIGLMVGTSDTMTSLVGDVESSVADTFSDLLGPLSDISSGLGTASTLISTTASLTGLSVGQNSTIISYLQNAQTGIGGAINIANGNIAAGAN